MASAEKSGVVQRDVTAEAYPEAKPRPDDVALTAEQKKHLEEYR